MPQPQPEPTPDRQTYEDPLRLAELVCRLRWRDGCAVRVDIRRDRDAVVMTVRRGLPGSTPEAQAAVPPHLVLECSPGVALDAIPVCLAVTRHLEQMSARHSAREYARIMGRRAGAG